MFDASSTELTTSNNRFLGKDAIVHCGTADRYILRQLAAVSLITTMRHQVH